jgi:hypothetical protein
MPRDLYEQQNWLLDAKRDLAGKGITWSLPLSPTGWAEILHVSLNTVKRWKDDTDPNKPYHFDEISPRKWRLPQDEIPQEYLENYKEYLQNIRTKKASKRRR